MINVTDSPRVAATILITGAIAFLLLAIAMPTGEMPHASWHWAFVFLPGLIGIANHVVTSHQRKAESKKEDKWRPKFREALASAIILTGVFCVVANASRDQNLRALELAGFGAYISVLWSMLVRLNANALSPRFLINSALKTAIAMLIAYGVAESKVLQDSSMAIMFLIGLFHSWALEALKRTAMRTFGITEIDRNLSLRLLEGIDDGAVDVLEELGITSVQHLATMHASEVCGRSLYPRDRVLDWIDQAILVIHTNAHAAELRALGIRTAYALITVAKWSKKECHSEEDKAVRQSAEKRLDEIANRLGLPQGGLHLLVQCIETDPAYVVLHDVYGERHNHVPDDGDPPSTAHSTTVH